MITLTIANADRPIHVNPTNIETMVRLDAVIAKTPGSFSAPVRTEITFVSGDRIAVLETVGVIFSGIAVAAKR